VNLQSVYSYKSTVSSDANGKLDLLAELNYDNARTNSPIAVVMHGYSPATGNFSNVRANAQRLRDAGFFVISVAMRGRDGSDGVRDSGGLEVYDIYDAVESVKAAFPALIDPTNVHITGYSGGGGNAMSALTKFPDYFRAGSSFFGMSDYGYNNSTGWYYLGAESNHKTQLNTDIGNPMTGGAAVQDKYLARASNLASRNNPYSEIHLFANSNEPTCPAANNSTYRDNAIAHASSPGEFDNIHVHVGAAGTYQDFDNDSVNDPNEQQNWPHGFPTADQQAAGEGWYLSRLLNGSIPQPVLRAEDEFFVAGFVKTKKFELRLGDGANAAGTLNYRLSPGEKVFALQIASSNPNVRSSLWIETSDMGGGKVDVFKDNAYLETITSGPKYLTGALTHNTQIALRLAVPGDYDKNGQINSLDYDVWRSTLGSTALLAADGNGNGVVDSADYVIWRDNMAAALGNAAVSVPEPPTISVCAALLSALLTNRYARGDSVSNVTVDH